MTGTKAAAAIAVMACVTVLLRAFPFLLFSGKRESPAWLKLLGSILPEAIIGMLVVYCLKDLPSLSAAGMLKMILASASVAALQWFKGNSLISILGGTVIYMLLLQIF